MEGLETKLRGSRGQGRSNPPSKASNNGNGDRKGRGRRNKKQTPQVSAHAAKSTKDKSARGDKFVDAGEETDEDPILDFEAAKIAALRNMHSFTGVGLALPESQPGNLVDSKVEDAAWRLSETAQSKDFSVAAGPKVQGKFHDRGAAPSVSSSAVFPDSTPAVPLHLSEDDASPAVHIVGTCELMCPASERELRERKNDIELFERRDPASRNSSDSTLCIKKYTRIVDNVTPDMVRTRDALRRTVSHLYGLLDNRPEIPFMLKSKFLWDRLRSVRQDLSLQAITDCFAMRLLEQMARFAILSEHELCEETATVSNPDGHNSHLNVEQLAKTLTSLRHMYDDHAQRGIPASETGGEAEMFSYQLLLRIDSHGRYNVERREMLNDLRSARSNILMSPDVQLALAANRAYHANNIVEFFRLVKDASYLQACLLHKYFTRIRSRVLETINSTFGKQAMPLDEVAQLLHADIILTEALAKHHGLNVVKKSGGQPGSSCDERKFLLIREAGFIEPVDDFPILRSKLVDDKRAASYLMEIAPPDRMKVTKLPSISSFLVKPWINEGHHSDTSAEKPVTPKSDAACSIYLVNSVKSKGTQRKSTILPAGKETETPQLGFLASVRARQNVAELEAKKPRENFAEKELEMKKQNRPKTSDQVLDARMKVEESWNNGQKSSTRPTDDIFCCEMKTFVPTGTQVSGSNSSNASLALHQKTPSVEKSCDPPQHSDQQLKLMTCKAPASCGEVEVLHSSTTELVGGSQRLSDEPKAQFARFGESLTSGHSIPISKISGGDMMLPTKELTMNRVMFNDSTMVHDVDKLAVKGGSVRPEGRREASDHFEVARAKAAECEVRKNAKRIAKCTVAILRFTFARWWAYSRKQAYERHEKKIRISRANSTPVPGIMAHRLHPSVPLIQCSTSASRCNISTSLRRLKSELSRVESLPWGHPLDVPQIILDVLNARGDVLRARGQISQWKLLVCCGEEMETIRFDNHNKSKNARRSLFSNWLRSKLSRGGGQMLPPTHRKGCDDKGEILSCYSSRLNGTRGTTVTDVMMEEIDTTYQSEDVSSPSTLLMCVRDVSSTPAFQETTCAEDRGKPFSHASAAVYLVNMCTLNINEHPLSRDPQSCLPVNEVARLIKFVSSLSMEVDLKSRDKVFPLVVLVAAPGQQADNSQIVLSVREIVLTAQKKRDSYINIVTLVKVLRIPQQVEQSAELLSASTQWNKALEEGLRWAAIRSPPIILFRMLHLQNDLDHALSYIMSQSETTPDECVDKFNQAVAHVQQLILGRIQPSGVSQETADEFLDMDIMHDLRVTSSTHDAVFLSILSGARLPAFPGAGELEAKLDSSELFCSAKPIKWSDRVHRYLTMLNPGMTPPPGAVGALYAKAGYDDPSQFDNADCNRHNLWTAIFREIFAYRLADVGNAQQNSGAGPVYISPQSLPQALQMLVSECSSSASLPVTLSPSILPHRTDVCLHGTFVNFDDAQRAGLPKIAPRGEKRKRIGEPDPRIGTLTSVFDRHTQLSQAQREDEVFESWLTAAASVPTSDTFLGQEFESENDIEARLRKVSNRELSIDISHQY